MENVQPDPEPSAEPRLDHTPAGDWTVSVVRTGGFAGLRREWRVTSASRPEVDWRPLVEACEWDAPVRSQQARDGFMWRIQASGPSCDCAATVAEPGVTAEWRELINAVTKR